MTNNKNPKSVVFDNINLRQLIFDIKSKKEIVSKFRNLVIEFNNIPPGIRSNRTANKLAEKEEEYEKAIRYLLEIGEKINISENDISRWRKLKNKQKAGNIYKNKLSTSLKKKISTTSLKKKISTTSLKKKISTTSLKKKS